MPVSYFPPLPESIWGNIEGDISIQKDLVELIAQQNAASLQNNLIINSAFDIWQRVSAPLFIISRERASNIAILETEYAHHLQTGDFAFIMNMSDFSYDALAPVTIQKLDDYTFSYASIGSDESNSAETSGLILSSDKIVFSASNSQLIADRWISLCSNEGNSIFKKSQDGGICIKFNDSDENIALMQIIPAEIFEPLKDEFLSLRVELKSDVNTKIAILAWTGTSDNTDRDPIDNFGDNENELTTKGNWELLYESSLIQSTEIYQVYDISGIKLEQNYSNISVLIYNTESTIDDEINIKRFSLLNSSAVSHFKERTILEEKDLCLMFFEKSYLMGVAPGVPSDSTAFRFPANYGVSSANNFGNISFVKAKYKLPIVRLFPTKDEYSESKWSRSSSNFEVLADKLNISSFGVKNNSGGSISSSSVFGHFTAEAEL